MNLSRCLHSLCGYGVSLVNRDGRLVIRSATYTPDAAQTACLKANKPLLLSLLPEHAEQPPGAILDALEAYNERIAIMAESDVDMFTARDVATAQAQQVLSPA